MKTARCSSCGLDTHLYCQGSGLEQEEEELVTCLMCEARGGGGKDANELRALVHKKLLKKATKNILPGHRGEGVFEGTKWFRPYTEFLENYSACLPPHRHEHSAARQARPGHPRDLH